MPWVDESRLDDPEAMRALDSRDSLRSVRWRGCHAMPCTPNFARHSRRWCTWSAGTVCAVSASSACWCPTRRTLAVSGWSTRSSTEPGGCERGLAVTD